MHRLGDSIRNRCLTHTEYIRKSHAEVAKIIQNRQKETSNSYQFLYTLLSDNFQFPVLLFPILVCAYDMRRIFKVAFFPVQLVTAAICKVKLVLVHKYQIGRMLRL